MSERLTVKQVEQGLRAKCQSPRPRFPLNEMHCGECFECRAAATLQRVRADRDERNLEADREAQRAFIDGLTDDEAEDLIGEGYALHTDMCRGVLARSGATAQFRAALHEILEQRGTG